MKSDERRRQNITLEARGSEQKKTKIKGRVETKIHPRHKHTNGGTSKVLVNKATTVRGNKKTTFVPNLCLKSPKNNQKKKKTIGAGFIYELLTNDNAPFYKFRFFLGCKMFSFFC
jgi:hypothetical protein